MNGDLTDQFTINKNETSNENLKTHERPRRTTRNSNSIVTFGSHESGNHHHHHHHHRKNPITCSHVTIDPPDNHQYHYYHHLDLGHLDLDLFSGVANKTTVLDRAVAASSAGINRGFNPICHSLTFNFSFLRRTVSRSRPTPLISQPSPASNPTMSFEPKVISRTMLAVGVIPFQEIQRGYPM